MNITKDAVFNLYVNRELSTQEISEIAGCSPRYIRMVLRDFDVNLSKNPRRKNGYVVNNDFFKHWSNEMAYVLGFILADGNVSKNTLTISQKDQLVLNLIRDAMRCNCPIKRDGNIYKLHIARKCIVGDLRELGITENKSLTIEFPQVPAEYLPHFIRGVIDGDGWVHKNGYMVIITSGSPLFAFQLYQVLSDFRYNTRVNKQSGAYRIIVSGKEDIKRLARWIYTEAGVLYLPRKRYRMETHLNEMEGVKWQENHVATN
jgi:DNA-binding transcriptional regulator WhiA